MVVTRSGSQLGNSDMSALSSSQSHSQSFELKEEGEEESFLSPTGATIGSPASRRWSLPLTKSWCITNNTTVIPAWILMKSRMLIWLTPISQIHQSISFHHQSRRTILPTMEDEPKRGHQATLYFQRFTSMYLTLNQLFGCFKIILWYFSYIETFDKREFVLTWLQERATEDFTAREI